MPWPCDAALEGPLFHGVIGGRVRHEAAKGRGVSRKAKRGRAAPQRPRQGMRCVDVEERHFRAASEARERGTESRRGGRAAAWLRNKTYRQHPSAYELKRKSEVEERPFRAASEAREKGTESRRDGRNAARVETKPINSIATRPEKSARTGHPA